MRILLVGAVQIVAGPWLYLQLAAASSPLAIGTNTVLLSALGCMGLAPILIFLNERFPTAIRASGTGLSWNIGFAIGGMMPTFVSLVAGSPAELPGTLAIFIGTIAETRRGAKISFLVSG